VELRAAHDTSTAVLFSFFGGASFSFERRLQPASAERCYPSIVNSDANLELVVVLDTNDRYAFALAEGCLREAEIPFFVLNQITTLVNDIDPFARKWLRIQVARDREAEAREIIAAALQPVPLKDDELYGL
jgi:hypothetical protein